nr:retrovirus-related Pol polyprotein from transposon TNT 1-94 [Tanacetum cinerariifolium]
MGLWYMKDSGFELTGFLDANYAGCKDIFKSTSGGAKFLGEKLVSWSSKKQDCTALSTAEAEYVSLSASCAQVLWMRTQLTDYGFHFNKIPIYCDLKSAIAISFNSVQHSRTKHIAVRYHFIKEHVEKGTIELYFVKMDYQLADIFKKALPADRFDYLVRCLARAERIYPGTLPLDRVEVLDLLKGKRAIGSKWVFRNKKDERGIVIRNKARLVGHGHTQEEGIDYEEVFDPLARIEAIRLFLAYASFMAFMVYQMDVKSDFHCGTIAEEVYVFQRLGFEDPDYLDKVYKVVKALYGLHQAPRAWYDTLANYLLGSGFQRGKIDQTLFIKKEKDGKSASTPVDTEKPLLKDPDGEDVESVK